MSVGTVEQLDFSVQEISETGVKVRRLSDGQGDTIAPYFTQPMISQDNRLVLVESTRTGQHQLHLIDLVDKTMTQVTSEPGVGFHRSLMDINRKVAYHWAGRLLRRVDLSTLQSEALYEIPEGFRGGILSIDHSGRYLAFVYAEALDVSTATGRIYSDMKERYYRRPSCVVIRYDVEERHAEAVWGEHEWISHVAVSPVDPDLVLFCHEGPWARVHRMWVVRASSGECWPLIDRENLTEKDGHEYFTHSGKVVTQYAKREYTDTEKWEEYNLCIWPDGSGEERFSLGPRRPGHVQTSHKDETLLVGDGAFPRGGPDEEDWRAKGHGHMALIRHRDGVAHVKPLCPHNTSWKTQHSHPHPVFTPDDKSIIFNSDCEGVSNVYQTLDVDRHAEGL